MTSVLGLLDDVPPGDERDLRRLWDEDVLRSLTAHAADWVAAAEVPGALDRDRGWWLLGWVEDAASLVAARQSDDLVRGAAFAMSLLEASPLDRRDVLVVAALVRRASTIVGLDYRGAVRAGCGRAGKRGETMERWLLQASQDLPPTYEQIGSGSEVEFRRSQSDRGLTEEEAEQWLAEDWRD
jgi:hypothetical protein